MSERRPFSDYALVQLTLVRFREFTREPEAVFWTFIFPILLAAGLGLAFRNRAPEKPQLVVVDGLPGTAAVAKSLGRDTRVIVRVMNDSAARHALRTARAALLVMPHRRDSVEYAFDPARSEASTARLLANESVQAGEGRNDPVRISDRTISEPGSRYIDFVVPGLLGMNLMGSGIWGIAFSIVTARNKKLLKRLMATPMSRVHFLLSYMLSRLLFLVLEVVTLLGFAVLVFGVPMRGSFVELGLICLMASLAFAGLGLLVSSRARTTEGVSGLTNLVMLPMWIFSGVFFSSANFPAVAQPVIRLLPLTAVNNALRANMLEGTSILSLGGELAVIAGAGLIAFFLALKLFRWR